MVALSETEYGVIVDRTSKGLGFQLLATSRTRLRAEEAAEAARADGYPVEVKVRQVTYTDWHPAPHLDHGRAGDVGEGER